MDTIANQNYLRNVVKLSLKEVINVIANIQKENLLNETFNFC